MQKTTMAVIADNYAEAVKISKWKEGYFTMLDSIRVNKVLKDENKYYRTFKRPTKQGYR